MDIFGWNVRGINDPIKRRSFRKWLRINKPLFGGLLETHVSPLKAPNIVSRMFQGWSFEGNYEYSDLGKIWVVWHPSVKVTVLSKSLQMISCLIKLPFVSVELVVSFVYASSTCSDSRKQLWLELENLASSAMVIGKPWTVLGDFNQVLSASEHYPHTSASSSGMRDFQQCLISSCLSDLPFCGNTFTWTNKHDVGLVAKKLDRILINDDWLLSFPNSLGVFGDPGFSDHSPCCIFMDSAKPKIKKPFRFFSLLNQNPEFSEVIKLWWGALNYDCSNMLKVSKKLKELKGVIRTFSKQNYSQIEKRVQEAYDHLVHCQQVLLSSPSQALMLQEKEAHKNWCTLARAEESFLRQKSRVCWMEEGDKNSKFFHRAILTRQAQNQIIFLLDDNDQIVDSKQGIQSLAVDYYKNLLGGHVVPSSSTLEEISALVPQRCSPSDLQVLSAPFTPAEIKSVFFSLPRNKAPGPDGYCAEYFTAHWEVVGHDMIAAVLEFFNSGQILQQWNATLLTLIPKTTNARRMSEFRPIACCNTIYKVISKLLANRIKSVLPGLISNSQSAFIPGRLLVENVLLATELIQGYNHKNISARGMLKVDLKKAFDSVHWDFIMNVLKAMEFPSHFVKLIGECISSTRFSISINGESCGYFKGTKGLRQGDPLSPYLFVLAMEGFTQMLSRSYSSNQIGFHPNATDPEISHLAFADDIMVFFDGMSDSLENIASVLQDFSSISGLSMNKSKTDLFVAGLSQNEASRISSLGFNLGSLPIRYLGLPLMHRKLRIADYRPLLDKISSRFSSWSSRALSYAGRKELISSVIYGTINFWASAFILPKAVLNELESLCAKFLWNGDISKRVVAKVAWDSLCLPKNEGGLGLKNFRLWNKTLCLKLIWRLFSKSDSLWAQWLRKNRLKDGVFWALDEKKQSSWTWKSLLYLRATAINFIRCNLGNGRHVSFWYDWWTLLGPLVNLLGASGPAQTGIPLLATVASACSPTGWNIRPARSDPSELLHIHLASVHLPSLSQDPYSFVWVAGNEELNNFSTSKTWEVLRMKRDVQPWTDHVWYKGAIPRHAFHMWLTHLDRLPTRARLASWGMQIDSNCCLCGLYLETRDHLFLHCEVTQELWMIATTRLGYNSFAVHTWEALSAWLNHKDSTSSRTLRRLVAQAVVYAIWRERNNRYHNNISTETHALFKALDRQIRDAILGKKHRKAFKNLMQAWLRYD